MQTYDQANDSLTGRNKNRRKVGNNTYANRRENGDIAITLHDTDVVTYHSDGTYTLNSGGWLTVTTKDRLNSYSPFVVHSIKGRWQVNLSADHLAGEVPFYDGMRLDPKAFPPKAIDTTAEDARNHATYKAIDKYARNITADQVREIVAAAEDAGIAGDCMFCAFKLPGKEHLQSHVDEGYYMYSLYRNALEAKGYRDPAFILSDAPQMVRSAVRAYLRKALLTNVQVIR